VRKDPESNSRILKFIKEYYDDWFYFYKDEEDIIVDINYGSFEIIDVINSWEICKSDPFIMIVKDSYEGGELGYVTTN
tara:strand:+ start:1155 stop:1388 length:234 start_codon:yes stop_codon:yes gene_type:complete